MTIIRILKCWLGLHDFEFLIEPIDDRYREAYFECVYCGYREQY